MVGTPHIAIRFCRDNSDQSGASDDILRIDASEDSARTFSVTYTDNDGRIRNTSECTEEEVFEHLDSIFDLLPIDTDPFEGIQIYAPTFPSVMISTKDLDRARVQNAVYRIVRNTLRNFPVSVRWTSPRSATA